MTACLGSFCLIDMKHGVSRAGLAAMSCWPFVGRADPVVLPGSTSQAVDWGGWLLEILAIVVIGKFLFLLAGLVFVLLHLALLSMLIWGVVRNRFWQAGLVSCSAVQLLCYGGLFAWGEAATQRKASSDGEGVERGLFTELHPLKARWEAFATPEVDPWLPAPTDTETLVAKLTLSADDVARLAQLPRRVLEDSEAQVVVAPNSARPWLGRANRALLSRLSSHADQAALDGSDAGSSGCAVASRERTRPRSSADKAIRLCCMWCCPGTGDPVGHDVGHA